MGLCDEIMETGRSILLKTSLKAKLLVAERGLLHLPGNIHLTSDLRSCPNVSYRIRIVLNDWQMCVLFQTLSLLSMSSTKDLEASICGIDVGIWQSCSINALDESKETPQLQGVPPGLKVILSTHVCSHSSHLDPQRIKRLNFE